MLVIHYHGGPITPATCALRAWRARHAFISYFAPRQITLAAEVCQSFALDNGAFSFWKAKCVPQWEGYYEWALQWLQHPGCDFALVPDVIEGTEEENDALAAKWRIPRHQSAVVWHTNESIDRLLRLAQAWPRVCIGSSGQYDVSKPAAFLARMREVLPAILTAEGYPICKLHGLRMLNPTIFSQIPLASADSTNVARNIGIDKAWRGTYQPATKETRTTILVERIEAINGACRGPSLAERLFAE
jgi:hypothetical protein